MFCLHCAAAHQHGRFCNRCGKLIPPASAPGRRVPPAGAFHAPRPLHRYLAALAAS